MRLDPHYPFLYIFWLGHAFQSLERYEEAIVAYQRTISRSPDFFFPHIQLAAAYARLGRMEEANAEGAQALRMGSRLFRSAYRATHAAQGPRRARAPGRWHAQGRTPGVRRAAH